MLVLDGSGRAPPLTGQTASGRTPLGFSRPVDALPGRFLSVLTGKCGCGNGDLNPEPPGPGQGLGRPRIGSVLGVFDLDNPHIVGSETCQPRDWRCAG